LTFSAVGNLFPVSFPCLTPLLTAVQHLLQHRPQQLLQRARATDLDTLSYGDGTDHEQRMRLVEKIFEWLHRKQASAKVSTPRLGCEKRITYIGLPNASRISASRDNPATDATKCLLWSS
jgi:hypothetical protein